MSKVKLVVSEAVRSVTANIATAFAATMTVLIGMFLLGLFLALGSWVVSWSDHVKNQLEVKIFFVENVTPKQVDAVRITLEKDQRVKEFQFVSKDEALSRMRKRYPELTANLPSNPLPASYEVLPKDANDVKAIAAERKAIFREHLVQLRLFREVQEMINRAGGALDGDLVREFIILSVPGVDYEKAFATFIDWVRYGDLFAYDSSTGLLSNR